MKRLAIFDLDGTLFRWQLFHELVFELNRRHAFDIETAHALDTALLDWQAKRRPWNEYEMTIVRALRHNLPSISPSLFDEAAAAVVTTSGHKIYNYTKRLAESLKREGYFLLAVTGSHQEIAEPFATAYGFDDCIGVLLERKGGKFTGQTTREVYSQKAALINDYAATHRLTLEGSVAIGDSAGDIPMLELAERAIAFNPSEELLEAAMEHDWEVVVERKNIAYQLRKGNDGVYLLAQTDRY